MLSSTVGGTGFCTAYRLTDLLYCIVRKQQQKFMVPFFLINCDLFLA